ncbi:MAG: hypothetical protein NTW65_05415 [Deltaproteobacteria bacterium]|nr:hypothetical protein [Deltaproteobacteria bacterium]
MCDLAINKSASGSFTVGTEGVYTISVTNAADSNDPATGITVTDQLPNELIYVSAEGNGWTCGYNTSNRTVTCTRPGPLAAGAAAPDITLKVIVGDALSVTNTATVTVSSDMLDIYTANNSKSVTTPVSGSTPPSSGNKPLYLYDSSTLKLSRTPMGISTNYVTIAKGGNTASWNLSPVLPSAVTINSGTQNIQGHLRLSTNNNGTYSIPITLRCGTTPVASVTMSCDLNGTVKDCPFNLPPTTYTCPKDSYWGLDVTNNRNVFLFAADVRVWPTPSANNYSYVNLPSKSVISVDSIGIYNNSYLNGGSVVTSVSPGNTVYIRAMVSDPFGAYDINGAIDGVTVTLTPPPPGTSVKYNMVPTSYSTSASKLYEYGPYTVPTGGGSLGDWNVAVEAKEGTEGTVKDTSSAKMPVVIANLTIMKTADKPTGKVNSGVGEIITYTITVTNNGTGPASNAIVTDPVPTYTTYVANSTRMNGGPPPSITVAGDGATSPLIAGLLVDDNTSRGAGVAATGILPAGKSATITFKVTVN